MRTTFTLVLAVASATTGLPLVIAAGGLVLLVYLGVVLPAVWSTRPTRRRAAADVLRLFEQLSRERDNRVGHRFANPKKEAVIRPGFDNHTAAVPEGLP